MRGHNILASDRWTTLSFVEQLGNIGSEVDRSLRAFRDGKQERFAHAYERALELFDLSLADDRWEPSDRREIFRLREEFCRLFLDWDSASGPARELSECFLEYAIAAREAMDR
jgi:hypothetical protein